MVRDCTLDSLAQEVKDFKQYLKLNSAEIIHETSLVLKFTPNKLKYLIYLFR